MGTDPGHHLLRAVLDHLYRVLEGLYSSFKTLVTDWLCHIRHLRCQCHSRTRYI